MPRELSILIADLSNADAADRSRAAEELSRLAEEARPAAVPLARAAGDNDEEVREWSTAALEEIGPPSPSDLIALTELLAQPNADAAYWAATLLGRLKQKAANAAAPLCAALQDDRPLHLRERAAWALGKIGPPAGEPAIAALKRAAADSHPRLARVAERALQQITSSS